MERERYKGEGKDTKGKRRDTNGEGKETKRTEGIPKGEGKGVIQRVRERCKRKREGYQFKVKGGEGEREKESRREAGGKKGGLEVRRKGRRRSESGLCSRGCEGRS